MTQNEALLDYLVNHKKGITIWGALELGITSLHKNISDLEKKGHVIKRTWVEGKNRFGNKCRLRRYLLDQ